MHKTQIYSYFKNHIASSEFRETSVETLVLFEHEKFHLCGKATIVFVVLIDSSVVKFKIIVP